MSQLPRYGGQLPKSVQSTTTRTTRIPGTNKTVTQSRTVVADVSTCGDESQVNIRGAQGGIPRPGVSGIRAPSGIPGAPGSSRPQPCEATTCSDGPRPPQKPSGLPQVRIPGLQRPAHLTPGQASAVQQPRAGGLPQPSRIGQPRPTGLQQPSRVSQPAPSSFQQPTASSMPRVPAGLSQTKPSGLQRPSGLPTSTQLQRPTASGLQRPTPTGLQRPTPTGLQRPTPGVQTPTPTSLPRPTPTGLQRPTAGVSRLASGLRPPAGGMPSARRTPEDRQPVCRGPCSAPARQPGLAVQPATPDRQPMPAPISPQTPAQVLPERPAPQAPQRPTERPRGAEAYKKFIFESKFQARKTKPSQLFPPAFKLARGVSAEERASKSLMAQAEAQKGEKVTARAASISPARPQYVDTPEGREMVLKQTVLQKRVERDEGGEKIVKSLKIIDAQTGDTAKKIEMNLQQLDPNYPIGEGKEAISITSKVSVSRSHTTVTKEMTRATTETVAEAAAMAPEEIAKLVEEENEDVDNTLKMLPPDLVLSPGRYEMKKRLQHLQLNSESVALLEQSITRPAPRADEAQNEPTPEVMAAMMHTVEKGVPPQSTPDQVFNTLFVETSNERYIKLSPVTQGPLQDVVVPTEVPLDVHKEVITDDMEKLTEKLQNIPTAAELPVLDIFDQVMAEEKKSPSKGKNKEFSFQPISDEKSLWVNANLEHLVNVVGATPVDVLDPANVSELETSGKLEEQMSAGVEYYVDADPVQYMSRVQLRGTQLPSYFPGYMLALPEFPEIVKLASSPDEVFSSAWKSAQPKYFPDESMQSLIY